MRVKGSYTLENSIIVPIFTMFMISLILTTISLHDGVVKNAIAYQGAMKLEQENEKLHNNNYLEQICKYVKDKTMRNEPGDDMEEKIESIKLPDNNPRTFIRRYRGIKTLVE